MRRPVARGQAYTLVELLLALALGALIALAASRMLVGANAAYLHHAASARLDAQGRQALAMIGRAVRQAAAGSAVRSVMPGAPDAVPALVPVLAPTLMLVRPEDPTAIAGLDAATIARDRDGIAGALPGAIHGSDVLALRFPGSGPGKGDGAVLDCAGFAVDAASEGWSIFYVAQNSAGEMELRCKYKGEHGWGADAVATGVDTFQVLYGVDTDTPPDGIPNRYLTASEINALHPPHGGQWWKRVASVQVALLLHGEAGSSPGIVPGTVTGAAPGGAGSDDSPDSQFDLFGSAYSAKAGDTDPGVHFDEKSMPEGLRRRVRRIYAATIMLRNPGGG